MRKLFILGVSSLFLGSPALSATYSVDGFSTGNEGEASSGDAPRSVSGGGNAAGFGGSFSATATNVGGGSVAASASEGISDVNRYTFSGDEDGVVGESEAGVQYAIEIVGPTTNALIPVDVTMLAHADALSLPFIDGFANSIVGFASAGVLLGYANGLATAPSLPDVEAATRYDYKTAREDPPVLDAQTERFNGVVMMAANEVINVSVVADVQLTYSSALGISETASGSASADPTFAIDDPAFANYTIVGAPVGPAATAAPEPATWAMMLLSFAGLGFVGYRKAKGNVLLAA